MKVSGQAPSNTVLAARAEASAWITQLHGPNRTLQMEQGFRRWLSERPENAAEFEGITEVWDLVAGGAPARGTPRLARWEHTEESKELAALRALRGVHRRKTPRLWAQAAVILLSCGLMVLGARHFWPTPSYSTDIGEQRIVQLSDSTRVSLNADSRLSVDFGRSERYVRLERGEAFFEVAKDRARPFVVSVGDHRVVALGTSFVVRVDSNRIAVTLMDGKVAVSHANSGEGVPSVLAPGERLTIAKSTPAKIDSPRLEAVTAWRRGEVMLDDTPLADAVAEMNRYDKTPVIIDTPAIAGLIVSGLYHTGDNEGFARSVAKMYQLRMISAEGRIHLEKQQ